VFVGVAAAATRRCIGCNAGGDHWGAGGHHWWAGSTPFAEGDILASVAVGSEAAVVGTYGGALWSECEIFSFQREEKRTRRNLFIGVNVGGPIVLRRDKGTLSGVFSGGLAPNHNGLGRFQNFHK